MYDITSKNRRVERTLPVYLTDSEKIKRGQELAQSLAELQRVRDDLASYQSSCKARQKNAGRIRRER